MSSASLYGGTYNLLHYTLPKLGIEVTFVDDPDDLDEWAAAVRPNTKAFYAESIGNPKNDFLDIRAVADLAHGTGVPLIIDNTVASPWLIRPFEHGADIVVHSATKFIGGHGTAIGGVIVDAGTFDFSASDRFPQFVEPDPATTACSTGRRSDPVPTSSRPGCSCCRDIGAAISPFNAFLLLQGLETLSLRMERHNANAQRVVDFLAGHPQVESVQYAGLGSSPWHDRAKQLTDGRGFQLGARLHHQGRQGRRLPLRRRAEPAQPRCRHR